METEFLLVAESDITPSPTLALTSVLAPVLVTSPVPLTVDFDIRISPFEHSDGTKSARDGRHALQNSWKIQKRIKATTSSKLNENIQLQFPID